MISWLYRRRFAPVIISLGMFIQVSVLNAAPTNILYWGWADHNMPTDPIPVGYIVVYTAVFNDAGSASQWAYRCTLNAPPGNWVYTTGGNPVMFQEGMVGTQDVQVTETGMISMGQPLFSTFTISVEVDGPDTESVSAGLNVSNTIGNCTTSMGQIQMEFSVSLGDYPIGPMVGGYPQERIQRPWLPPTPAPSRFDSGWSNTDSNYYYQSGKIIDVKTVQMSQNLWDTFRVGDVLDEYIQTNRMIISACDGTQKIFTFASHHFQKVKSSVDTFKMVEVAM
jgi:hypothetical protein